MQWTSNTKLWLAPGLRGATGNHYCGLHEFEDMSFLLHLLRPRDVFADIGANVGTYTILASGHVGASTYAFEPVPASFEWLQKNINDNQIALVAKPIQMAVTDASGPIHFTAHLGAMNHAVSTSGTNTIEVQGDTLDNLLQGVVPLLIKIDVEGNESAVLRGAISTIQQPTLKALIVEMSNQAMETGKPLRSHEWLLQQGFEAFTYEPYTRKLIPLKQPHQHNTIYLRDLGYVITRLQNAPAFSIWGISI